MTWVTVELLIKYARLSPTLATRARVPLMIARTRVVPGLPPMESRATATASFAAATARRSVPVGSADDSAPRSVDIAAFTAASADSRPPL